MGKSGERDGTWTLLTGHGHVLVEIARNPQARIRDISAAAGLTERTVQAIVGDLEAAGYITRTRTGRRTRYTVNPDSLFRHPAQGGHRVGPFLALFGASDDESARPELGAEPGLCGACRHAKLNETRRGTAYLRCIRAEWDATLVRYPRLPVVQCTGFERQHRGAISVQAGSTQPVRENGGFSPSVPEAGPGTDRGGAIGRT